MMYRWFSELLLNENGLRRKGTSQGLIGFISQSIDEHINDQPLD
jgi:hypothetical protein